MKNNDSVVQFWDKVFGDKENQTKYDPNTPLSFQELEKGIKWLADGHKECVLDFGSGNGKLLMRTVVQGFDKGIGITSQVVRDLEKKGICINN